MSCGVCIKKYTNKHRRKITCQECNYEVCSCCLVKYIMSVILTPCCMHCGTPVYICLYRNLISTKKYAHIIRLSFEKKILLEEADIIKQQHIKDKFKSTILDVIGCSKCNDSLVTEKKDTKFSQLLPPSAAVPKVLSPSTKSNMIECVSCAAVFCASCFSQLESDTISHECVIKLKPCPKCCNLIEKEDAGCDQMFCVLCNTSFSWETCLIVDNDSSHNPHYYQWKKKTGELRRHDLDNPKEGRFYIKCQNDFKDQKLVLSEICTGFGFHSMFEVNKKDFLLSFHSMFLNTLLEVSRFLEKAPNIRHNLQASRISNTTSLSLWKKNLKKHFYLIQQYEAVKYNILKTLDRLYTMVLEEDPNDEEIEKVCLQSVQQNDNILMY